MRYLYFSKSGMLQAMFYIDLAFGLHSVIVKSSKALESRRGPRLAADTRPSQAARGPDDHPGASWLLLTPDFVWALSRECLPC